MHFIDLDTQRQRIEDDLRWRIDAILRHGKYILGPEISELEATLTRYVGTPHVISCANGTDALQLCLLALGVGDGDAVVCPAFTFAATAEAIALSGASPVFADVGIHNFCLAPDSASRAAKAAAVEGLNPKAIVAVDLFGHPADYPALRLVADELSLFLVSDAAQALGSSRDGKRSGAWGDVAATSFYPSKPLGCYGDGGAVFTHDGDTASLVRSLARHGVEPGGGFRRVGMNSRLDTLQAGILLAKWAVFQEELKERQLVASRYAALLGDCLHVPQETGACTSNWAHYTIRVDRPAQRETLQRALSDARIPCMTYYRTPLHHEPAYRDCLRDPGGLETTETLASTTLSLPMHPYLSAQDQKRVSDVVLSALGD